MEVLISGLLCGLVGVFIGHRLALGRDKRVEYNSVVRSLKQQILGHIDSLNSGSYHLYIKSEDILRVRCWIPEKQFNSIKLAHESYSSSYREGGKPDGQGGFFYKSEDLQEVAKLAAKIESLLHIK